MGLDLAALAANTDTIDVEFMGQTASVTYKPTMVTSTRIEAVDARTDDDNGAGFMQFFAEILTDWDVMQGDKKVPLTVEALRTLPLVLLRAIFLKIMREAGSGEAGRPSNAG